MWAAEPPKRSPPTPSATRAALWRRLGTRERARDVAGYSIRMGWVSAVVLGLVAILGCSPSGPVADGALQQRAVSWCEQRTEPSGTPNRPFRSDGCTLWPDGFSAAANWRSCCVDHDIAYWCGGTPEMRAEADRVLKHCVGEKYAGWMGALMKPGVLVGGHPWLPTSWRWGYGHDYPAPYYDLDALLR